MQLLRQIFILTMSSASVIAYCPDGWVRYDDSCYLFGFSKLSWHSARTHCKGFSADLVVPETSHENNFIKTYLKKIYNGCNLKNGYFWFGANDLFIEGDWEWVTTGRSMTLTDWAPNEPSNSRWGNCAAYFGQTNFTWDDYNCDVKEKFICEYRDDAGLTIIG